MATQNNTKPVYVSKRKARNIWQEYRIYPDRLELQSRVLFRTFIIPINNIEKVVIGEPPVIASSFQGEGFWSGLALKIDWSDLFQHVVVNKKTGFNKYLCFSPDNATTFTQICNELIENTSAKKE